MTYLDHIQNVVMSSAGLAIKGGGSAVVAFANAISGKANGLIATPLTAGDTPSLATSLNRSGETDTLLSTLMSRGYTLLGSINATTGVITLSWVHGEDYDPLLTEDYTRYLNYGDPKKFVVGHVIVYNGTAADFDAGTTALDTALLDVTYINAFGVIGQ